MFQQRADGKTIILGGVSVRDASAAKNRKPANLQIKPLDVEKLELNVNHWFYTSHHSNPTLNYFRQTTYMIEIREGIKITKVQSIFF